MKRRLRIIQIAATLSILLALVTAGIAYAITITVDGVKEAAWGGSGGQTPGYQTDDNESAINDAFDIKEFKWTNDASATSPYGHMYFLLESYSAFNTNNPPYVAPENIRICFNIDNDTGTGYNASGYCNDMQGIDRYIDASASNDTVVVKRWNGSSFVNVNTPSGGLRDVAYADDNTDGVADYNYIEIGVDLASLGITNGSTCIGSIPTAIYYDNGMGDEEDKTPESGTFDIGCGTPTAVSFQSASARTTSNATLPLVAAAAVLFVGGAGTLLVVRRRKA